MGPNPPWAQFRQFAFGPLGADRIVLQYVLLQMVKIGLTEHGKEIANARPMSHARMRRVETNLKVDQVRKAIVADDDVFSLVEIDIGQPATVQQPQRPFEHREKRLADDFAFLQRMTGYVFAGDCRRPDATANANLPERIRHVRQVREQIEGGPLSFGLSTTQPRRRGKPDRLFPIELADDESFAIRIRRRRSPRIVLVNFVSRILSATDFDDLGRIGEAQGAEDRRTGTSRTSRHEPVPEALRQTASDRGEIGKMVTSPTRIAFGEVPVQTFGNGLFGTV